MRVLVQSLKKFVTELMSFPRVHDPWHAFDPRDELYALECSLLYSQAITLHVIQDACSLFIRGSSFVPRQLYYQPVREVYVRTSKELNTKLNICIISIYYKWHTFHCSMRLFYNYHAH